MPSDGEVFCVTYEVALVLHVDFREDDVLKARLKTVGVSEYKFEMEVTAGRDSGTEWRIVDVGGSRSQVWSHAWCFYIINSLKLTAT